MPLACRACLLAVVLLAEGALRAQQTPTFGTRTVTVPVFATVTDARGNLVTDLRQSDFRVEEDGRQRPVTVFSADVQPITVAILLDRSPSLFASVDRLRGAAVAFINALGPGDRASVGTFGHTVTMDVSLSADSRELLRRLDAPAPFPAGTAMWDAINEGRESVARESGRRVVLVFTDAADNCSVSDIDALRTRLEREGIMLYAVGVRGREGLQGRELQAIARATGGWYFEMRPDDDVTATSKRIAEELRRQYVLGFTPEALDDRTHRVGVRVTKGGLTVRARRSYFAPRDGGVR